MRLEDQDNGGEADLDLGEVVVPPEVEALFGDLREAFAVAPSRDVAARHLAAMARAQATAPNRGNRRLVAGAGMVLAGLVATSGMAAAGALPDPAQRAVAALVAPIGIDLPHPDDDEAPDEPGVGVGRSTEAPGRTGGVPVGPPPGAGVPGEDEATEPTPPGQAQTPPGQAQTPPGQAQTPPGQAQTPPGQAQTPPGQAQTPPGQAQTPPGQAQTPPGQAQTPPGQAKTPPGQAQTPPGQAQTPPGQAQTPPGQAQTPPSQVPTPPSQPGARPDAPSAPVVPTPPDHATGDRGNGRN
jgi:hypothetical protein